MKKLSHYQQDAVDAIVAGKYNVALNAVAGAGKTTVMHEAIKLIDRSKEIIIISFARAITDDHKKKVSNSGRDADKTVRTVHSLGLSLAKDNGVSIEGDPKYARHRVLNGIKPPSMRELDKLSRTATEPNLTWGALALCHLGLIYDTEACPTKKSVEWLKTQGISKEGVEAINWGVANDICDAAEKYHMFETNMLLAAQERGYFVSTDHILAKFISETDHSDEVIEWALWVNANKPDSYMGFVDMICLPVRKFAGIDKSYREWVMPSLEYDYLFVDEVQDLSPAELYIIDLIARKSKIIVIAGDPRQWVYSFKGTQHDAYVRIKERYDCIEFGLPQTFRCDTQIVNMAARYVEHIIARDDADEGVVDYVSIDRMVSEIQPGDMVIGRKIRHLIELGIYLMHLQKKVQLSNRGVGKSYMNLIPDTYTGELVGYFDLMAIETDNLALNAQSRSEQAKLMRKKEKYENLAYIANVFNVGSDKIMLKELFRKMDKSYEKNEMHEVIVLQSVHQVKGTEADRVWLMINPNISLEDCGEDAIRWLEETNVAYVGITRAKHELLVHDVNATDHLAVPAIIESGKRDRKSVRQITLEEVLREIEIKQLPSKENER